MSVLRPRDVAPDDLDAPFWEACRDRRFLVHRCTECGRAYWPASTCLDHGSSSMEWQDASGRGEVHTYTVVHHVYDRSLVDKVPYVVAVVRLDEGPFFHTDIVGCEPQDVHVGMRVRVLFDEADEMLPRFTPRDTANDDPDEGA
jgi:uncharacterized OB-fold protein